MLTYEHHSDTRQRDLRSAASTRVLIMAMAGATLLAFAGCSKVQSVRASLSDVTGSVNQQPVQVPDSEIEVRQFVSKWDRLYRQDPKNKNNARNFARGLRAARRPDQAVAVLQKAVMHDPRDNSLLADYGKALADAGRFQEAANALERAQSPETPSWSILSAQGSVADQMGNHTLAQQYYLQALKHAPGEPRIMSNLGLSYALSKELSKAEQTLRQATAHPRADGRVLQNLSLVLALQGKFDEAENLQRRVLSASDASANIAAIRRMIAQSNTWREISSIGPGNNPPRKINRRTARR